MNNFSTSEARYLEDKIAKLLLLGDKIVMELNDCKTLEDYKKVDYRKARKLSIEIGNITSQENIAATLVELNEKNIIEKLPKSIVVTMLCIALKAQGNEIHTFY